MQLIPIIVYMTNDPWMIMFYGCNVNQEGSRVTVPERWGDNWEGVGRLCIDFSLETSTPVGCRYTYIHVYNSLLY